MPVPYEGRLDESFVEPGDLVDAGQLLARMDSREIEWKLSGLMADHDRARKQRDASLAERDTATSQMSRLEMERLALEIRLLEQQAENLEIKSPIRGIVVSGDPQKLQGARLPMGETIVEIAPLDKMVVEVHIPDHDIRHVAPGDSTTVKFEGLPGESYSAVLDRVHPRAEQRDGKNVFVGNVKLSNVDHNLRPGMNGRASIQTARHCLAWNLFHRAWDGLRMWLLW